MCAHSQPHADVSFLLCQQWTPIPDLQLEKQFLLGALPWPPTSFLGPLGWGRGRRTSKEGHSLPLVCLCLCVGAVHTCPELGGVMEVICGPWSHTEGLAARHCHHQPTPVLLLVLWA